MPTVSIGMPSFVTLSVLLTPLSLEAGRSGGVGAPGATVADVAGPVDYVQVRVRCRLLHADVARPRAADERGASRRERHVGEVADVPAEVDQPPQRVRDRREHVTRGLISLADGRERRVGV